MSGFPSIQPAFTVLVAIASPLAIGSASRGTPLAVVPMTSGTVKSEPGFEPALNAELDGVGYDYIRTDGSGTHMRLDVRSQLKDTSGSLIAMYYKGAVRLSPETVKVLSGAPDAKTTEFGDSVVNFSFETGAERFKALETMTFVGAGRFVVKKDGLAVEYKVSRVIAG
ncbi:hypothetical protein EJ06DRAFT_527148 [Trichodelitschia bisporula]|uniref:Uncharacterized protein n=1 Tax=Trichodelitschia bisporula TaxID=703511 RepID=A0A6G1I5E3_9PEZI|nr:hypothetical protein EJ06DRAFT_527148 [Trichodelitschia bisporula]